MTKEHRRGRKGGGMAVAVGLALLLALPVLYALSYGPVAGLLADGYIGGDRGVYRPIRSACIAYPAFGRAFGRYVNLWMPANATFTERGLIAYSR